MTQAPHQPIPPRRNRLALAARNGDWVVGILSFAGVVLAALIAVFGPPLVQNLLNSTPAQTAALRANAVLELPNVASLPIGVNKTPISAKLKSKLPSGRQIFLATQGPINDKTPGRLDAGNLTFLPPCSVNEADDTYRCDDVQLGQANEGGIFKIYIGLANSTAAHVMGHGLYAQALAAGRNEFVVNKAPDAGFDVVGEGITVQRDGPVAGSSTPK